jgi:hypothetical protein
LIPTLTRQHTKNETRSRKFLYSVRYTSLSSPSNVHRLESSLPERVMEEFDLAFLQGCLPYQYVFPVDSGGFKPSRRLTDQHSSSTDAKPPKPSSPPLQGAPVFRPWYVGGGLMKEAKSQPAALVKNPLSRPVLVALCFAIWYGQETGEDTLPLLISRPCLPRTHPSSILMLP